ncbi:MAG: metal-sensing transcriptional repressor [Prochlorotrichaceae cyanobacterium]|jgi:DNA-binding FrmR family transcriptional regulator
MNSQTHPSPHLASDPETIASLPHSHSPLSCPQSPILHPEADPHSHVHDETSQRRLVNRLSRIEGHIRGVKTMIQEHRPCPEVLVQIAAVRGALDKVARVILDEHLTQCIVRAAKEGDAVTIDAEIEQLRSALNHFL